MAFLDYFRLNFFFYKRLPEPTDIHFETESELPGSFQVFHNYPNPFNAVTTIQYDLPQASDVSINIYNILGCKVKTLISKNQPAGYYQVIWNADNVSSGLYFYRIQANNYTQTKKMLLLK